MLSDRFPELSETFVAGEVRALRRLGHGVAVEAVARPVAPAGVDEPALIWDTESTRARLAAMVVLAARHPWRCARDLLSRSRWRREESVLPLRMLAPAARRLERGGDAHLHVHFAAGAALGGMRIARITGTPWSVTAHAWEIYQRPANLREKLTRASFVTSGCAYTVRDLRAVVGPRHAARVHEVVMGVDADAFRRRRPSAAGRIVLAVGRLVEKKGFADLVEAAALMRDAGEAPERIVIVGDGPLRDALAERIAALGLRDLVELRGALSHDAVRDAMEGASVLCAPCVVAADGDRDSMPVVVKEALALEVPVVGTYEVGLPEIVRPEWGRLAPPNDPAALAAALYELLALSPSERAAMGRAGRAHVVEHADVDHEARRLAELIRSTTRPKGSPVNSRRRISVSGCSAS